MAVSSITGTQLMSLLILKCVYKLPILFNFFPLFHVKNVSGKFFTTTLWYKINIYTWCKTKNMQVNLISGDIASITQLWNFCFLFEKSEKFCWISACFSRVYKVSGRFPCQNALVLWYKINIYTLYKQMACKSTTTGDKYRYKKSIFITFIHVFNYIQHKNSCF